MKITNYKNTLCDLHLSKKCSVFGCKRIKQQILPSDIEFESEREYELRYDGDGEFSELLTN